MSKPVLKLDKADVPRCNTIDVGGVAGLACRKDGVVMGRCVGHAEAFRDDKLDDIEQLEEFVRRMDILIRNAKRRETYHKRKKRRR